MKPTFTSPPPAGTATARTTPSAPPLPLSGTTSCAAPSAGRRSKRLMPPTAFRLPVSPRAKYNENRVFCHKTATAAGYNRPLFQELTSANSLLGGSMEFLRRSTNSNRPNNRKTTEFERAAKTGRCRRRSALRYPAGEHRSRGRNRSRVPYAASLDPRFGEGDDVGSVYTDPGLWRLGNVAARGARNEVRHFLRTAIAASLAA